MNILYLSTAPLLNIFTFQPVAASDAVLLTPQFFMAVFAGLVLALIFQLILTALSIALGISMVGNIKEQYVHGRVNPSDDGDDENNAGSAGLKISTGFGVWSTVTTCLATFGGTALALHLNIVDTVGVRITLALVIWGLFFLILFYLESRLVSGLVGGLVHTATAGLKSSVGAVKNMFSPSDSSKIEHSIDTVVERIHKEFGNSIDTSGITKTVEGFFGKMNQKLPDYDTLKKDLEDLLKESKKGESSGKYRKIQQVITKAVDESSDSDSADQKGRIDQLKGLMTELKKTYGKGDDKAEGVEEVVARFTSVEKEEIEDKKQQLNEFLSKASPEELSSDNLEETLSNIINHPNLILSMIASKFKGFKEEDLQQILEKNTNLKKEQYDKIKKVVSKSLKNITEKFNGKGDGSLGGQLEGRVRQFLEGTHRKELDYDSLRDDVSRAIDTPGDSLSIIKERLSKFDSATLKALVTNNSYIDESQIDEIMDSIEEGRNVVTKKIEQIETRARQEIKMLERKAVIEAEHARKTAASAAWWLVASTVLSAGAAILGGFV